jgi:hypothetical protein
MNKDQKKAWAATRRCSPDDKIKHSCGSTKEYETGERACPAIDDPLFTEQKEFEKEMGEILKAKPKKR